MERQREREKNQKPKKAIKYLLKYANTHSERLRKIRIKKCKLYDVNFSHTIYFFVLLIVYSS